MSLKSYYVYILSGDSGSLYIGVTNDLLRRVFEYREGQVPGFTQKYGIHRLVYYEETMDIHAAIQREKQLKKWNRAWKVNLIQEFNPQWKDLFEEIRGEAGFPPARE